MLPVRHRRALPSGWAGRGPRAGGAGGAGGRRRLLPHGQAGRQVSKASHNLHVDSEVCRGGCSVPLGSAVLLVGGSEAGELLATVTRYTESGLSAELPGLRRARQGHGCARLAAQVSRVPQPNCSQLCRWWWWPAGTARRVC